MKLIKLTTSKESVPGNRTTLRRHGIFECPVCLKQVERPLTHGKRNKTCGNKACRKAAFTPNSEQIHKGGRDSSALCRLDFYNNIKNFYRVIHNYEDYTISEELNTLQTISWKMHSAIIGFGECLATRECTRGKGFPFREQAWECHPFPSM